MTRINTNVSSMIAQFNLQNANNQLQTSLTRLSTGLQINSGADNPAGLIEGQTLGSEITSINASLTNAQQANDVVSTADAALAQVSDQLQSIRGLVQSAASSGTSSASEIAADQQQVDSSLQAIQQIAQTTIFGNQNLLNGSFSFDVDASGGSLGAFASPADVNISSFNPALEGTAPASDVALAVTQAATQATNVITGDSATSGVGLNNLSTGSTHATSTLLGANYAVGATTGLNNLSTNSTHGTSTIVGANYTGTTTGLNNLSTNSTHGTATIVGANYTSGATTGLNLLSTNSTHSTVTISKSDLAALAGSGTATLTISGNVGGPETTASVNESDLASGNFTGLIGDINSLSSETGVTAATDGSGNIVLTSAYVGSSSTLSVSGTVTGAGADETADQAALTGAIGAKSAGTDGAATATTFTVAGNLGSKTVTLANNDTVINGGVSSLATLINTVTADTGVTATVNGSGNLVLTSAAVGNSSAASLSIAEGDGASADQSLVTNSQSNTAGTTGAAVDATFTVTGNAGSKAIDTTTDDIINGGASALATLINNVSANTGVTAAVNGSGNLVLTSAYVGSSSAASLSVSDGNDADATLIGNSQSQTSGTTGAAQATTFTVTGNTGSYNFTLANNDTVINGGASSLVSLINTVTAQTGVTASLNGSGNVVLTSGDVGSSSAASIAVATGGNADDTNLIAGATQTQTAGTTSGTQNTTTIELNGDLGQAIITVNNDDVIDDSSALANAINAVTSQTGITASTTGGQGANVTLTSQDYGSTAQVSAQAIAGSNDSDITLFNAAGTQTTTAGDNVEGTVTTSLGSGSFTGTGANFTYTDSNISLSGTTDPSHGTATANFNVSGGALFQIGPEVNYENQVNVSLGSLDLSTLGRDVNTTGNDGLSSLETGGDNQLSSSSLTNAANIVDQAIDQVATLSGQLGALQTNVLDSATSSLQANLEQVTSAQSNIMDADFASETANLTRAQILVQSGMSVLSIANSQPQNVLTLLQKIS